MRKKKYEEIAVERKKRIAIGFILNCFNSSDVPERSRFFAIKTLAIWVYRVFVCVQSCWHKIYRVWKSASEPVWARIEHASPDNQVFNRFIESISLLLSVQTLWPNNENRSKNNNKFKTRTWNFTTWCFSGVNQCLCTHRLQNQIRNRRRKRKKKTRNSY